MHFTLNLTALCYMYIRHIPLWIVKMHQSFLLSRSRKKNMCVYYCMEKLNGVGRLENVFTLLKKLYGDNRMEKKNFRVGSKKQGWSDDSEQTYLFFFGPIHFDLLHLFHLALLGQEKI